MGIFAELKQQETADEVSRNARPKPAAKAPVQSVRQPPAPATQADDRVPHPVQPAAASVTDGAAISATTHPVLPESGFDLAHEADKTNTYSFSKDELWAINDMVQELDRQFDVKVTRYNLVRLAVHCLIEDFRCDKENSFALNRLRYLKK